MTASESVDGKKFEWFTLPHYPKGYASACFIYPEEGEKSRGRWSGGYVFFLTREEADSHCKRINDGLRKAGRL